MEEVKDKRDRARSILTRRGKGGGYVREGTREGYIKEFT
jgi:hypothetical protein